MHGGGGMHGRGNAWWGVAGGVCGGGHAWQGGHVWQEKRQLQRAVRILLECILVLNVSTLHILFDR